MFDKISFEKLKIEKGIENKNIELTLGKTKQAINKKINGITDWSIADIDALIDMYNLTDKQVKTIFFTKRINK